MPKILIVLTSHNQLGDTGLTTGFWLEELAAPYYVFKDAGAELTLASPRGGPPPLDPKSDDPDAQTESTRRFKADSAANVELAATAKLDSLSAHDFDAVFYPGGHGPLWDLVDNEVSIRLIEDFWAGKKPVSAVCHAPIALVNAKDENGQHIVKGREVTGFTNSEEEAVGLSKVVPLLVEDTMLARGAKYSKADDWQSYTRQDGNLITGQNPGSSEAVAKLVLAALERKS
ncbi:MAG: putative intracellular protease/amidase [Bacteroidia bacterium]|jgi:putative intracellular protease/amidase